MKGTTEAERERSRSHYAKDKRDGAERDEQEGETCRRGGAAHL